jgi:hypothetical protein
VRRWVLFCVLFVCVSCAAPVTIDAQNTAYRVTMTFDQRTLGFRSGVLTVTDTQGTVISDATVTLTAVMRQHGMMTPPLALPSTPAGYTFEKLEINMVGEWQMLVRIVVNGQESVLELPIVFE